MFSFAFLASIVLLLLWSTEGKGVGGAESHVTFGYVRLRRPD
jgi:hypothetical protein